MNATTSGSPMRGSKGVAILIAIFILKAIANQERLCSIVISNLLQKA